MNDYSQGDRVEGMGEWGCDAEILEPLAYTTPSIQLNEMQVNLNFPITFFECQFPVF